MSKINLNLQLFGNGTGDWTHGVTESAIREAYDAFVVEINKTKEYISNFDNVKQALWEGWTGVDTVAYIAKFGMYTEKVIEQIDQYSTEVGVVVDDIINNWTEFQTNLIE